MRGNKAIVRTIPVEVVQVNNRDIDQTYGEGFISIVVLFATVAPTSSNVYRATATIWHDWVAESQLRSNRVPYFTLSHCLCWSIQIRFAWRLNSPAPYEYEYGPQELITVALRVRDSRPNGWSRAHPGIRLEQISYYDDITVQVLRKVAFDPV